MRHLPISPASGGTAKGYDAFEQVVSAMNDISVSSKKVALVREKMVCLAG